jgi:hypothetical protein
MKFIGSRLNRSEISIMCSGPISRCPLLKATKATQRYLLMEVGTRVSFNGKKLTLVLRTEDHIYMDKMPKKNLPFP